MGRPSQTQVVVEKRETRYQRRLAEEAPYQCKLCSDKFKTTADLQKHKRTSHRKIPAPQTSAPKESQAAVTDSGNPESKSAPEVVAHEKKKTSLDESSTSSSHKTQSKNEKVEIQDTDGRYVACNSCGQKFDKKDSVVMHLLRQSQDDSGACKCPFCFQDFSKANGPNNAVSPNRNISGANVKGNTCDLVVEIAVKKMTPSLHLSVDRSSASNKRKRSSSNQDRATGTQTKTPKLVVGHLETASTQITRDKNFSSPANFSSPIYGSRVKRNETSNPTVPMISDQMKRSYELTYRKLGGKGSRGGLAARRTSDEDSRNSVDPLKVSVLINSNPYPSDTRLAVPKGKQFQKGNIHCPYCGFEAKSVREVQFHVNTHMPKSYPCEFCSHVYRSKQAVLKHTEKHHSNADNMLVASNASGTQHRDMENDQRSVSNYSLSTTSDGGEIENSFSDLSQDSSFENNFYLPAVANMSYYTSENLAIPSVAFMHGQAVLPSYVQVGSSLIDEPNGQDILMLGGNERTIIEKVLEISNF